MDFSFFLFIVVPIIILYFLYVSVIKKRNKALEALSGIDIQLKKRHNIIPNILTIAKKFMEHEKSLIEEVTKLRTKALEKVSGTDVKQKFDVENQLHCKLGQLMVAVENYPQLKSDQTMVQAMQTYNEVEQHIAAARRFYNSAANELRNVVQIFPTSIIADALNIKEMPFFETDEISKAPVDAGKYF